MATFLFLECYQGSSIPADLYYASCVAREVASKIRATGHTVIEVLSPTPQDANSTIQRYNPDVIWFVGHGNRCITTLENMAKWISVENSEVYCDNFNAEIVNGKIVNALSCLTGQVLGPKLVSEHGCNAYLGYEDEFYFLICTDNPCPCGNPKPEGIRKEVWEAALKCVHESNLYFCYGLAQGMTTDEASEYSYNRYYEWIDYFENIEPQNEDEESIINVAIQLLWYNSSIQRLYETSTPPPLPPPQPKKSPLLIAMILGFPLILVGIVYMKKSPKFK